MENQYYFPDREPCCFVTMFRTQFGERQIRIAFEGLRAFGGAWKDSPICVFLIQPCEVSRPLKGIDNIIFDELKIPAEIQGFPFTEKVAASSQAEKQLSGGFKSMIWIDAGCLITNPPGLFELDETVDASLRPVHIKNVGSMAANPPDPYWQYIYAASDTPLSTYTITSFCDQITLRPYFNLHCFSINPALDFCQSWLEYFRSLVRDENFQANACRDEQHQIFLHQAIFSTLVVKNLNPDRIRLLPATYNYPLHLHAQIPEEQQAKFLNDLVNPVYEDEFDFPKMLNGLKVAEPLHSWLSKYKETAY